jgi:phage/plasmid-like protein (TIGR03299 family)
MANFFKGSFLNNAQTAAEAMKVAGLDWDVQTQPLFFQTGHSEATGDVEYGTVEDQYGVVRSDTKKVLGVVGGRYHSIQNAEAFDFIDGVINGGWGQLDTAGSFNGGKRVWMSVSMGDMEIQNPHLLGDSVKKYIVLSNTHDGSGALQAFFSNVRVICQNTLNMALKAAGKDGLKIRHTMNAKAKMEEAAKLMKKADEYQKEFLGLANGLAATPFTLDQMVAMAKELMPQKEEAKFTTRNDNNREQLIHLFTSGQGNAGKSLWDAYNAITEYADHHRSTRVTGDAGAEEQRLASNWFGSGFLLKQRGLDLVRSHLG